MASDASLAVLYAAREDDTVTFDERVEPLTVIDVLDDGIALRGPRGGRYTLEVEDGRIILYRRTKNSGPIDDLRFESVAVDEDYEQTIERIVRRTQRLMADGSMSYNEWADAVGDAVEDYLIEEADEAAVRSLIGRGPDPGAGALSRVPERVSSEGPRYAHAYAVAVEDANERGGASGGSMRNDVGPQAFQTVVDRVVTRIETEANPAAEDVEDDIRRITADVLDDFTTAEHAEIVESSGIEPESVGFYRQAYQLVPWGDRGGMRSQAISVVSQAALSEIDDRRYNALRSNETVTSDPETFTERVLGERQEGVNEMFNTPDLPPLPILTDGGLPHTLMDEAQLLYLKEVPVMVGSWVLEDSGMVTDGENRQMAWVNPEKREMMVLVGKKRRNHNDWAVYSFDFRTDTTTELYRGTKFVDAFDVAKRYLTKGQENRAKLEIIQDTDEYVTVSDSVDHDALGKHILSTSGFYTARADELFRSVPSPVRSAGEVGVGLGRVASRPFTWAGGKLWDRFGREIGGLVLITILGIAANHIGKVIPGAEGDVKVETDQLGIVWNYWRGLDVVDDRGNSQIPGWEPVKDGNSLRRNGDGAILMRNDAGEERWYDTERLTHTFDMTVNPQRWRVPEGLSYTLGVDYIDVVDVFREIYGDEAPRISLGRGSSSQRQNRTTVGVEGSGAPKNPFGRSSSSSRTRTTNKGSSSRSSSSRSSSSRSTGGGQSGRGAASSYSEMTGADEGEVNRFFHRVAEASLDRMEASDWLETKTTDIKEKVEESVEEADADDADDDQTGSEAMDEKLEEDDRDEQLDFHENDPDVDPDNLDANTETDGGELGKRPSERINDVRRERDQLYENAREYIEDRDEETQEAVAEAMTEADDLRRQKGQMQTEGTDDISSLVSGLDEMRQRREASMPDPEEVDEFDPDEEMERAMEEGFYEDFEDY